MSNLAANQLRQARQCAGEGDNTRAVELLEQARVLAGGDVQLRQEILTLLAEQYEAIGRREEAKRCREGLPQPALQPVSKMPPPAQPVLRPPPPPRPQPPSRRFSPMLLYGGIGLGVVLLILSVVGLRLWLGQKTPAERASIIPPANELPKRIAKATTVAATEPTTAPIALMPAAPATKPATLPVIAEPPMAIAIAPPVVAIKPAPVPATLPSAPVASKLDRQDLLNETVGMCVVVARYDGVVPNIGKVQIDLPVGTGTAFSVTKDGVMLTNRHVVNGVKDSEAPLTLDKLKLPGFTRREVFYVVCFGPDSKSRFPAKLLYKSKGFDLAVLKIDRRVEHPLTLSKRPLRQGDDILVCGYPGVVMDALNEAAETPAKIKDLARKWEKTRHIDGFDAFSPDSFGSTLTKGIVSAPNRNVEGAGYVQIDAGISPGNSGGPVLNVDNEVIGIATWTLRHREEGVGASYNFALSVTQLAEELRPYLKN